MSLRDDLLRLIRLGTHEDTVKFINLRINLSEVASTDIDTILHDTIYYGSHRVLDALINNGLNIHYLNGDGLSALHLAAQNNHLHLMNLLIEEYRIGINNRYQNGDTILHFAIRKGLLDVVKWLLSRGADLNAVNDEGLNVIELAYLLGGEDVLGVIVNHFAENAVEVALNNQINATLEEEISQFSSLEELHLIGGCIDGSV